MPPSERKSIDPRRVVGYLFVAGMILAPFFALIYGLDVGLAVMIFALAATAAIAIDTYRTVDEAEKPRLRVLIGVVVGLAVICLAIFIVRVT